MMFPSASLVRNAVLVTLLPSVVATQPLQGAPPTLSGHRDGTNVVMHFSGRLQSASRAEGPYTNVAGARSPHVAPLSTAPQQFWRTVLSDVRTIAAGGRHTLAIRNDGSLWGWGNNQSGQLGIGFISTNWPFGASEPVQIGTDTDWQTVIAGDSHSLAIKRDGTLWAWGDNSSGQLGIGPASGVDFPVQVGPDTNWQSVATAGGQAFSHSLGIRTDGTLWAWGDNGHAQLGDGTTQTLRRPIQIGSSTNWDTAAAGFAHSLAIRSDGTLWAWGNNDHGQLGIGTFTPDSPFGASHPVQVGTNADWRSVAASRHHSLGLGSDNTMWAWGLYDQLAIGPVGETNRPTHLDIGEDWQSITAASTWTMALRTDGTLWGWGENLSGQLGVETLDLGVSTGLALRDGTNQPVQVGTDANWLAVAAGGLMSEFNGHTVALRNDGTVWAWGGDGFALGNGTGELQNEPIQVATNASWMAAFAGALYTFGLREDGTLWAWGVNNRGQLGIGRIVDVNYPVQVGTNSNWHTVAAGYFHTLALRADGTLWAHGQPLGGGLPSAGSVGPFQVSPGWTWRAVAAGGDWYGNGLTAAVRSDGSLWTWGPAALTPAQLGADSDWRTVAAGWYHGVAIKDGGTLWAWGRDGPGGLGTGIPSFTTNQPVQVGTNSNWKAVAAGRYHTVALRADDTLWAWGSNFSGELGNGSDRNAHTNQPTQVSGNSTWKAVSAGFYHTLAVRSDGTLWTWGDNYWGQLGLRLPTGYSDGSWTNRPTQVGFNTDWQSVAAGERHSLAVRTDGTLWAWGDRSLGQTAQPVPWLPHPVPGTNWLAPQE